MGNSSSFQLANACTIKDTLIGESEKQKLKYALSGMKGFRPSMEDRHVHHIILKANDGTVLDDHAIFAVFDGHGGNFASDYLEANFLSVLQCQPEFSKYAQLPESGLKSRQDTNGIMLLKEALVHAFVDLDKRLITAQQERNVSYSKFAAKRAADAEREESFIPDCSPASNNNSLNDNNARGDNISGPPAIEQLIIERSGSTAVAVLLTPSHILCANTGDSRAFMRRGGKVLPLSFDHKPSEIAERSRIIKAGGVVKGKRIDGDLAVSRAFGDFVFKLDCNLQVGEQKVSVIPDITMYPRDLVNDEFIVMACDGIWDVATSKECADYIQGMLSEGDIDLAHICEEALDTCLDRNSRDNMTIGLIQLPGMVFDANRAASFENSNVLWNPRTMRMARRASQKTMLMAASALQNIGKDMITCS